MIYAIAAVLVLILDQGLKYYVTVNIALDTGAVPIIPGILDLVNIHNTGAAFGILDGGSWRWIFVVIALLFIVIAVFAIRRGLIKGAVGRWALVGMLSGAIGNCIDRVLYGYVVDMFKPVFLEGTFLGAIFNVADMFISCCGILFCIFPRLTVTLPAFGEYFGGIYDILRFSFFKYKPELPACKVPSFKRHLMEIIGKCAALQITEISEHPFYILFHGTPSFLLSLLFPTTNIEYRYFYFEYNIDTRYCQVFQLYSRRADEAAKNIL